MILDVMMFTFLFLFTLVVIAVVLMRVYRAWRRDGEEMGAQRERALSWERIARARERVAVIGVVGPAEIAGDEWELPDPM